jgi:2-dehydro-3-deoxyphosphogluconate aldolase/(4S)-4-hydroxy-2-oxoglutarate aldolase
MSRPPTISDVATQAGVSKKTVSRVINGSPLVRPEMLARVEAAIAELGFVPDEDARNLGRRRSKTLPQPSPRNREAEEVLSLSPVISVVTLDDARLAPALARALLAGGLRTVEITLRTPAALDAIRAVARETPEMVVGAGTVLSERDLEAAIEAGARYTLSPGGTPKLMKAAHNAAIPFIPGVATASEIMRGMELGYTCFKFFPAEQIGGAAALKSLGAPLAAARFCPTGSITAEKAPAYLALDNVLCVGGSWIAPPDKIKAGDWAGIEAAARRAAALKPVA